MKVLTVSTIYPGERTPGAGVFIHERQRSMPDGVDVTVARMRPTFPLIGRLRPHLAAPPPTEQKDGLTIHDVPFRYVPGVLKQLDGVGLARALGRFVGSGIEKPDLLDAHFAYPSGFGALRTARSLGVPVTVTLRGTIGSYLGDARRGPIVETLREADRVISVSQSLADLADEVAGDALGVHVIPNGVDTATFGPGEREAARAELGWPQDRPVILTVGGLVPRKGMHRVIEALDNPLVRELDVLYVVVGSGGVEGDYGTTLRTLVADRGLERHVRFAGAVAHAELPVRYRAADVFVLATSNEGWANVLQEALACGTPVVTTDVGGNREVVGDESHGSVVPFGDGEALAEALASALDRSWDRDAIARWGRRRDWRDVGREVAAVYSELVD